MQPHAATRCGQAGWPRGYSLLINQPLDDIIEGVARLLPAIEPPPRIFGHLDWLTTWHPCHPYDSYEKKLPVLTR